MFNEPIFIIGTERSGSNLLRLILNSHSQLFVPHPPHILHLLASLEPDRQALADDRIFSALAREVEGLVRRHIHPWGSVVTADRLCAVAPAKSLVGLFLGLYDEASEQAGKSRWGCKSTFVLHHVRPIRDLRPGSKFVLLVRDPRDVAVSSRGSVFNPCHPFLSAELWNQQQIDALALIDELPAASIHLVRYESLLDDPGAEVERMCDFLGLPYEPAMLNYSDTADAHYTAGLSQSWRNAGRPILSGNHGRYKNDLSRAEIGWVETVAGETMERFGYVRAISGEDMRRYRVTVYRRAWFRMLEWTLQAKVEWKSLWGDRNHFLRWRRRAWIAWRRGVRCFCSIPGLSR